VFIQSTSVPNFNIIRPSFNSLYCLKSFRTKEPKAGLGDSVGSTNYHIYNATFCNFIKTSNDDITRSGPGLGFGFWLVM